MDSARWFADELDQPMFVVTASDGTTDAGCLVGFATQCSIHPLRFVVFISKKNFTFRVARRARALAVHLVPAGRVDVAEHFGGATGDARDKFAGIRWHRGPEGLPLLDDCQSWFVGTVVQLVDAGDHVGFVLDPSDGHSAGERGLGFQAARHIAPGHEA